MSYYPPAIPDGGASPVCRAGEILVNGVCVPAGVSMPGPVITTCANGYHWDEARQTCVPDSVGCPAGYVWDPGLGTCIKSIPDPTLPGTTPPETPPPDTDPAEGFAALLDWLTSNPLLAAGIAGGVWFAVRGHMLRGIL